MKVLVTGFEPFDGLTTNPSEILVKSLGDLSFNHQVSGLLLPVSFKDAGPLLKAAVESLYPAFVVCLGLAQGREKISFERVAINVMDARTPDNDGFKPTDLTIEENAPDGLFSSLPIKEMMRACLSAEIPAQISNSAGTYVCNQVMYLAIQLEKQHALKAGFIHLPSEQIMPIEVQKKALEIVINVLS